jgi:hypothetical protein
MKKLILILGLLFVTFAFTSLAAGLDDVADSFHNIFGSLPNIITLDKLIGQENAALFWARFLLWILIFAVIYYGATFAFKTSEGVQKNISITVAIVFASISALLIPDPWIVGIFQTYGILAGILVWIVPVIAALFVASKIDNKLIKALFYLGMLLVLLSIDKSISAFFGQGWVDSLWYGLFRLFIAIIIIAFFWNLLTAWNVGSGHGDGHSNGHDNGISHILDKLSGHDGKDKHDNKELHSDSNHNDKSTHDSISNNKHENKHSDNDVEKSLNEEEKKEVEASEVKEKEVEASEVKEKEVEAIEIKEAKKLLIALNRYSGTKYIHNRLSRSTFKNMLLKDVIPNIESNIARLKMLTRKKIHEEHLTEERIRKARLWQLMEKFKEKVNFVRKEIDVEQNLTSLLGKFREFAVELPTGGNDISKENVKTAREYIRIMRGLVSLLINLNIEEMKR